MNEQLCFHKVFKYLLLDTDITNMHIDQTPNHYRGLIKKICVQCGTQEMQLSYHNKSVDKHTFIPGPNKRQNANHLNKDIQ